MALTKVGAFWLKEKNGKKFFSGTVTEEIPANSRVFVYRNEHKKEDKHPDYTLHIATDDESQERRESHSQIPQGDDQPF